MRLALAFGEPVSALQARMSSHEFAEWLAFFRIEPLSEARADARIAILGAALGNLMIKLWTGKNGKLKPIDFIPQFETGKEDEPVDVAAKIESYFSNLAAASHNEVK